MDKKAVWGTERVIYFENCAVHPQAVLEKAVEVTAGSGMIFRGKCLPECKRFDNCPWIPPIFIVEGSEPVEIEEE